MRNDNLNNIRLQFKAGRMTAIPHNWPIAKCICGGLGEGLPIVVDVDGLIE